MDNRSFERLRTLIVDDNQHMINIVRVIMRGFGAKDFYEARDAAEAFDIVKHDGVDLIIVDYQMNLLDGLDFIKLVRTAKDSPNHFVPIIMLTAHSERSRVMAARDAGVTEFCCKPVTALDLYRKIAAVANSPREFVKANNYFGPDRRRHRAAEYNGVERRKAPDPGSSR
jgi:two-component system, chemotaxis family, chemotaxis protein CheY